MRAPLLPFDTAAASAVPLSVSRRLIDAVNRWFTRRQQRMILEELDATLLRDIGLTPEDLRRERERSFWR